MAPLALSTGHKLGLALAATAWILFSLAVALLVPRYRPQFPGRRGLPLFLVVTFLFFVGMLAAVEVFGAESEAVEHEGSTSELTTPATTNPGQAKTVAVREADYKIELDKRVFSPG